MLSQAQIENRVQRLLDDAGIKGPSVEPERVARKLGVAVRLTKGDQEVSGILYRVGEKPIIGVNEDHAPTRRRFTIAHELGHYVLHQDDLHYDMTFTSELSAKHREGKARGVYLRNRTSSAATDPKEVEANRFAAALLMPIKFLKRSVAKLEPPLRDENIQELAAEYEVSVQAMTFRLTNLGAPLDIGG